MGRLIDADALFKYNGRSLSDAVKYGNKDAEQQEWSYSTMMMYEIADEIDNAPTIDAVPVVHGRWETHTDFDEDWGELDFSKCSVCGNLHYDDYRYCPNCGAKMDAEEEPELIQILCKHASSAKKNEIGETVVYCEMCAAWKNVTLGDCYGNCECQEVDGDG